jgi:hypothetical protein
MAFSPEQHLRNLKGRPRKNDTAHERFWRRVNKNGPLWNGTPCWKMTGTPSSKGYVQVMCDRQRVMAHRRAYEEIVGPIEPGLVIDHKCRNKRCVHADPDPTLSHLEPVTDQVNVLRGVGIPAIHAAQTHCVHGHALTPDNTYTHVYKGRTSRTCRTCQRARLASVRRQKRVR